MGTLEVCDDGLHTLADQCAVIASRLVGDVPRSAVVPPSQATAGAVGAAYTTLTSTASILADWIRSTGGALAASAERYATTDGLSAGRLSAAGDLSVRG